jgi:hypothetical protein
VNGVDVLLLVVALLLLLGIERYTAWRDWDRYRRLSRRAHLNTVRGIR